MVGENNDAAADPDFGIKIIAFSLNNAAEVDEDPHTVAGLRKHLSVEVAGQLCLLVMQLSGCDVNRAQRTVLAGKLAEDYPGS